MSERREEDALPVVGGGPSAVRGRVGGALMGGGLAGRKSPDEPAKDGTQSLEPPGAEATGEALVAGFALAAARPAVRSSLTRASFALWTRLSSSAMSICALIRASVSSSAVNSLILLEGGFGMAEKRQASTGRRRK